MKNLPILLLAGCFVLGLGFNSVGCSSSPTSAAPTTIVQVAPTATPLCGSPSSQGLTSIAGTINQSAVNQFMANQFVLASGKTVISISVYFDGAPPNQTRVAIYYDNGLGGASAAPSTLIYQSNPQIAVASGWTTVSIPDVYLPPGTYWAAYQVSDSTNIYYTNTTGITALSHTYPWAAFPYTYPSTYSAANGQEAIDVSTCP